ncbi:MAG: hypothetical protein WCW30_03855 [Candidatus Gracilibacteria bacterium]|jgi:hypothetical protein
MAQAPRIEIPENWTIGELSNITYEGKPADKCRIGELRCLHIGNSANTKNDENTISLSPKEGFTADSLKRKLEVILDIGVYTFEATFV